MKQLCDKSGLLKEILQCNLGKSAKPKASEMDAASSCEEIAELDPTSPSGEYWVQATEGPPVKVYCNMKDKLGPIKVTPGFVRIGHIDMTNPDEDSPEGFKLYTSPKRAFGKGADVKEYCKSIVFPVCGIQYSKVCGRVRGYQWGLTNAFADFAKFCPSSTCTADSVYVDGVSITHGEPREHIWTYAAAQHEAKVAASLYPGYCPCTGVGKAPPSFVGSDYYCESGQLNKYVYKLLGDDPLWDGAGCNGAEGSCCDNPNLPWFCKELAEPTEDDLEVRICTDLDNGKKLNDEDVAIELLDLFVQ